jgi:hypothetical protein
MGVVGGSVPGVDGEGTSIGGVLGGLSAGASLGWPGCDGWGGCSGVVGGVLSCMIMVETPFRPNALDR